MDSGTAIEAKLLLFALSLKGGFSNTHIQRELSSISRDELQPVLTRYTKRIQAEEWRLAEREILEAHNREIKVISIACDDYPTILKEIPDPPLVLFWRGPLTKTECSAVVGARRATEAGLQMGFEIAKFLVSKDRKIVSGLALGLDAAAHCGAICGQSTVVPTIAVLGSGVMNIQPRQNTALADRIINRGGAIVSEYGVSRNAQRYFFPRRNRIISGLSRRTIVVEAAHRSGSLITARLALEQGRDVFAVAGPPLSDAYVGCNRLIKDGAKLLLEPADILSEESSSHGSFSELKFSQATDELRAMNLALEQNSIALSILNGLNESGPMPTDMLLSSLQADLEQSRVVLALLELEGVVSQKNGNFNLGQLVDRA